MIGCSGIARGTGVARRNLVIPARFIIVITLCLSLAARVCGEVAIEGRVALPKPHVAPVMTKRYQVVTQAGVMATDPPLGVVYLEGSFPRPASPPRAQMSQKDLAF